MATYSTASSDTSATAQSSSPLINLAPELRNKIYRLALVKPEAAVSVSGPSLATSTALLNTCSLVRNEATSIFHCENSFHVKLTAEAEDLRAATKWIEGLATTAFLIPKILIEVKLSSAGIEKILMEYGATIRADSGISSLLVARRSGRRDVQECITALSKAVDTVAIGSIEIVKSEQQDLVSRVYEASFRAVLTEWCKRAMFEPDEGANDPSRGRFVNRKAHSSNRAGEPRV